MISLAFAAANTGLTETYAVNHEILAAKIQEQVCKPLESLRDKHADTIKRLTNDGVNVMRNYRSVQSRLAEVRFCSTGSEFVDCLAYLQARDRCKQSCTANEAARLAEKQAIERVRLCCF